MPPFPKPKFTFEYDVAAEIGRLRQHKQTRQIPERTRTTSWPARIGRFRPTEGRAIPLLTSAGPPERDRPLQVGGTVLCIHMPSL